MWSELTGTLCQVDWASLNAEHIKHNPAGREWSRENSRQAPPPQLEFYPVHYQCFQLYSVQPLWECPPPGGGGCPGQTDWYTMPHFWVMILLQRPNLLSSSQPAVAGAGNPRRCATASCMESCYQRWRCGQNMTDAKFCYNCEKCSHHRIISSLSGTENWKIHAEKTSQSVNPVTLCFHQNLNMHILNDSFENHCVMDQS